MEMQVSIIIPVLDGASYLARCIASARPGPSQEVVVVDGGSLDASAAVARSCGAMVLCASRGRGSQMRAGAAAASASWLLFLHADSVLPPGWTSCIASLPADRAGYFSLALDSERMAARVVEWLAARRCAWLALPYGDQGLLIHADLLRSVGGMPDLPLMEDVELARRLGRKRLMRLPGCVTSSAARYERDGYVIRSLRNLFCLTLYYCGVPVSWIVKRYG